jgi:hypothetical protein
MFHGFLMGGFRMHMGMFDDFSDEKRCGRFAGISSMGFWLGFDGQTLGFLIQCLIQCGDY